MVDHNYKIAKRYYSYEVLQQQLNTIINDIFKYRGSLNRPIVDNGQHLDSYLSIFIGCSFAFEHFL
jgi:uncharacterized protein YcsI (UPF0317 family)